MQLSRAEDLRVIAASMVSHNLVQFKDYESFVGKLTHCVQVLPQLRPFLQPLHAFKTAVSGKKQVWIPVQTRRAIAFVVGRLHANRLRAIKPWRPWIRRTAAEGSA